MNNTKKEIENLKTEIAGLKIRLRRIEGYLLSSFSDPAEYIHESGEEDELLEEAKKIVREYDRASASLLQRRLSIGYARSARLLDELEKAGIVGSGEGSKPREVFKNVNSKSKKNIE